MLPIYPLDGGQIFRALLWFPLGMARSLKVVTIVGLVGVAAAVVFLFNRNQLFSWSGIILLFIGMECYRSFKQAQAMSQIQRLPKHVEFNCPTCREHPPGGPHYLCASCGHRFDPFSTNAICPHCQTPRALIPCATCGTEHSIAQWLPAGARSRRGEPPVIDV